MTKRHAVSRRSKAGQHTTKAAALLCGVSSVLGLDPDYEKLAAIADAEARSKAEGFNPYLGQSLSFEYEANLLSITRRAARDIYGELHKHAEAETPKLYDLLVADCSRYRQLPSEWTSTNDEFHQKIEKWSKNLPSPQEAHDYLFHMKTSTFVGPRSRTLIGNIKKGPLIEFWTDSSNRKFPLKALGQRPFDFWESSVFEPVKAESQKIFVNMEKEILDTLSKRPAETDTMLDALKRVNMMKALTAPEAFSTKGRSRFIEAIYRVVPLR